MPVHTHALTLKAGSVTLSSTTETVQADSEITFDGVIPVGTTNGELDIAIDPAKLKSLVIVSDKDLTLKTNSSSDPDDTLMLKASVPVVWTLNTPYASLITTAVSQLFVTNGGSADARLQIDVLQDNTPVL